MSLFHRHQWVEVKRYFVPPSGKVPKAENLYEGLTEYILRLAYQGETVVELRCEKCGDVAERRLPGDATCAP